MIGLKGKEAQTLPVVLLPGISAGDSRLDYHLHHWGVRGRCRHVLAKLRLYSMAKASLVPIITLAYIWA